MIMAICFGLAAGFGSCARAVIGRFVNQPKGIAYGTLIVNVVGSFALGALQSLSVPALTVIGVGFLGSFTTFSSFSRDVIALVEIRKAMTALIYLVATLSACLAAAAIGFWIS